MANLKVARAVFDTAATDSAGVANTTAAAHGLGVFIPATAVIRKAYYRVDTTFASTAGGTDLATIALSVASAGDLKAAISIADAGNVWDAGVHACLPGSYAERTVAGDTAILDAASFAASCILIGAAAKELTATVATAALTAGKLTLFVEYTV